MKNLIVSVFILISFNLKGQDYGLTTENNKCGVLDEFGDLVIPIIYDAVYYDFENNSFLMKKDNKFILNTKGKNSPEFEISSPKDYKLIYKKEKLGSFCMFKEKCVLHDNKCCRVKIDGTYKLEEDFEDYRTDKSNDYVIIKINEKFGLYQKSTKKTILKYAYSKIDFCNYDSNLILTNNNNVYQFINFKTNKETSPKFEVDQCNNPLNLDDMCYIEKDEFLVVSINNKEGVMNFYGKFLIKPEYERILADINNNDNKKSFILIKNKGKWFNYSNKNEEIKAKIIVGFFEDYAVLLKDGKAVFMNKEGEFFPDIKVSSFEKDIKVFSINCKYGLISNKGKIFADLNNHLIEIRRDFIVIEKEKDKKAMMNFEGKILSPYKYTGITAGNGKDILVYEIKNKFGIINLNGKELTPAIYDFIDDSDNLMPVKKDDKYGFIDNNGKLVIPFNYEDAQLFYEGLAFVKKNGKYGYINQNGEVVIDFIYENYWYSNFNSGKAQVKKDGVIITINKKGDCIENCY